MREEFKQIDTVYEEVERDLLELETTSNFIHYAAQIAGHDSALNSFKELVQTLDGNSYETKIFVARLTRRLSKFIQIYSKRGLSFFYPIPSEKTEEQFFHEPMIIIDKILLYGLEKGKEPIPDPNPIYEAFGISHHFPEKVEEFRNCIFLLYRNILLTDLLYPLSEISKAANLAKSIKDVHSSEGATLELDIDSLFQNIYVIESESGMKQGTAFHLENVGIITCDHCIRDDDSGEILTDLTIFRGKELNRKFDVTLVGTNKDLDIAVLDVNPQLLHGGLVNGSSNSLKQLQKIYVAGFPNYNFGDNGIFNTGVVTGFRKYSGLKHILVSCPLIAGNSGGPAFDETGKVIGVVVTGADKMSKANETEKHALIPIEAVEYI